MQRLNIIIDIADALDYLHNNCEPPIVHCDLKPSNILLDEDLVAHVGDFGLAKILSEPVAEQLHDSKSLFGIRGTTGYVAPGMYIYSLIFSSIMYSTTSFYMHIITQCLTFFSKHRIRPRWPSFSMWGCIQLWNCHPRAVHRDGAYS